MNESPEALAELATHAERAAALAAAHIASRRPRDVQHKDSGGDHLASQVVTEVDRRAEAIILEALGPAMDGLGLLTEERPDDGSRLRAPAFWCIDPLDGTLAYINAEPGPCVSIALVRRDGLPLVGVIHDVTADVRVRAIRGGGLCLGGEAFEPPTSGQTLRIYGDRSFDHDPRYAGIAARLGAEVHVGQAAVLNALCVLHSPPAAYFKLPRPGEGGGSLWDYAATACCFAEAGAVATTFAGDPLPLGRADTTFMADCGVMFATDAALASRVRAAAAEFG